MTKQVSKKSQPNNQAVPQESPSIFRYIPEAFVASSEGVLTRGKVVLQNTRQIMGSYRAFLVGGVIVFLLILVVMQGVRFASLWEQKEQLEKERQQILQEKTYWEGIVKQYKGYRDGYFQLALLEYRLGNKEKTRLYIQETLRLDPNFEEGRQLEKLLDKN